MPEKEFDPHGKDTRGAPCKACLGHGTVYCCQSLEYALAQRGEMLGLSVLPCFPGTNMEMNYCPFCGRQLNRVSKKP